MTGARLSRRGWRASLVISRYVSGIVLGWVAVVLIVSDIWRRATFRYLHDVRRRRQFLVLRRVAVGIALTLVIVFGLVSEIGSIATYIGFVTAGVAVALQNVILAVVAYFFLIGRYGVRVGDRITLAGVTGRVVDIGLVRIYLMELSGPDLHATGRMVVLSNAVLFQPTALFKQIPGADFVWHTVTLTIAATADVSEAHKRLKAAAGAGLREVPASHRATACDGAAVHRLRCVEPAAGSAAAADGEWAGVLGALSGGAGKCRRHRSADVESAAGGTRAGLAVQAGFDRGGRAAIVGLLSCRSRTSA